MIELPALTLWQPWASLCVLPRPCQRCGGLRLIALHAGWVPCPDCDKAPPFKTIETRSWPAPKALIGQRIAIHAAKREPEQEVGDLTCFRRDDGTWGLESWRPRVEFPYDVPLGAIVGTAVLASCVPMVDRHSDSPFRSDPLSPERSYVLCGPGGMWLYRHPHKEPENVSDQLPFGDFAPGRWAWLLADAERLDEPIPARGGQRIWKWRS